ncbi:nitroreductase family deazaflavin-dependent oxidoreductase [Streptomyces sp. NPDC057798]|uniref:nitroreductase family deazaflavin-dependent oxidoreductase n=1 Tax=Streptomyces sp. NPDC057798 TaxID=3346252 RepID=UPI0036CEAF02
MASHLLFPSVVLTTTGRRSGLPRATPLCAYRYANGAWLVAATNFGRTRHPQWSGNLLRHAEATITWEGRVVPVTARLLPPAEHAVHRPQLVAMMPVFDHYTVRATGRQIRVFLLEPTTAEGLL